MDSVTNRDPPNQAKTNTLKCYLYEVIYWVYEVGWF